MELKVHIFQNSGSGRSSCKRMKGSGGIPTQIKYPHAARGTTHTPHLSDKSCGEMFPEDKTSKSVPEKAVFAKLFFRTVI